MIGTKVLNYKIEKLLGVGGMGSVYLASNENIDQKVAIKVLNENLSNSTIIRQRFKEEAKMLCSLDHSNIVKFLNFVENEDGIFLIMEYIDGITLDEFIAKKNGLIIEERVYDLFDQILNAFTYAHKKGIVHRDIKPANILLTDDNDGEFHIKVMDFGIARIISESNEHEKNWIVGTPSYMSPEQVVGEDVDQRSDIYSLGVLLHQMLTGRTPYDATTLSELKIKDKVVKEPLPRMKDYYAYISEKMQKIVDKAVEKDRKKRFQSCSEFRSEMKKALRPDKISQKMKYAAAAILFFIVASGIWVWDYNRVKVSYFKDYVEQWGVPQGIGKLSRSNMRHINRCYKFESRYYKLNRVSHVNSKGKIIEDGESERYERPLDMKLFYTNNGKISFIKILDRSGKVLYKKTYNEKLNTIIFQYDDEYSTEKCLSAQTIGYVKSFDETDEKKGKISRWLIDYDKDGYVSTIQYAGFQNILVGDKDNIFGRTYQRDKKGRVLVESYLGHDGKPKATKWGMGMKKFYYDDKENWIKAEYYTVDGNPAYDDLNGVGVYEMEYDEYGNIKYFWQREHDGNLMLPKKSTISGAAKIYDNNGFEVETQYLGLEKQNIFVGNNGFSKVKSEYDKNGYLIKSSFFDIEGNPCKASSDNAYFTCINDKNGNVTETWSYDINGKLIENSENYAGSKMKYDSLGNMIECIYYGTDKKPCQLSGGYAGYRQEYNEVNKITKFIYLGVDLKPCFASSNVCIRKYEYDKSGNETKRSFYDAQGVKLVKSNENVSGWNSVYDENGNETERFCFNENNQPCQSSFGWVKWVAKYDEKCNQTEIRYYGTSGSLCLSTDGYAGRRNKYDERGNVLESFPFGTDEKLAKGKLIARYKYDKFDNQTEFSVYENDIPATNSSGYFKTISVYNERNQELEISYYGVDNQLIILKDKKYAKVVYAYDDRGNVVQISYLNTDNRPCNSYDGYSSFKKEYDAMNRVTRELYFDVSGKPTSPEIMVPEGMVKYDKWGNMIYIAAGDGHGNLINSKDGWAIKRTEYDAKGNVLKTEYFDKSDKPCLYDGQCKIESRYNSRNKCIETKYYDEKGGLRSTKYAIVRYQYDDMDRQIEMAYFDNQDRPCNNDNGQQKIIFSAYEGNTAQVAKIQNAKGETIGNYRYINGKWTSTDQNNSQKAISDWHSILHAEQKKCPQELKGGKIISSIQLFNNSCTITIKYVEISLYNLEESELTEKKNDIDKMVQEFKAAAEMPRDTKLTLIMVDKANREVYKATY
jgi:serine/threonine-protein kinase